MKPQRPKLAALAVSLIAGLAGSTSPPNLGMASFGGPLKTFRGRRPCRECGKPNVKLWREKGIDLCFECSQKEGGSNE